MKSTIYEWQTSMMKLSNYSYAYIQAKGTTGLSNAGLIVGKEFTVVIDTLTSVSHTESFLKSIRNITDKKIKYLIITHQHPDHCMGNHLLNETVSICNQDCYHEIKRLSKLPLSQVIPTSSDDIDLTGAHYTLPDITMDRELIIHIDNREIQLLHYGVAHTIGDSFVYIPDEEIIFCGDILFLYATPLGVAASFSGWIDVITKVSELDAKIFVPGHGPVCDRNGLLKCRDYLMLIYNEARKAFDAGLHYKEAATRIPLGEYKQWAEPERIVVNIARMYREFRGEDLYKPNDPTAVKQMFNDMHELKESIW